MNPRFQPGGDKYDELRNDDRRAFYERVQADKEEIISVLKSVVSTWTENEIEAGNTPTFEHFVDEYSEWDREPLHGIIVEEMKRIESILSRTSEAV